MAKIPDATALPRVIPQVSGQIDVRGAGANISAGVLDVAQAVSGYAKRKRRNQLAKAASDMSTFIIGEEHAYDEDPDYDTIPERFLGNTESKLGEIAASIDDTSVRNEFVQNFRPKIAASRERVDDVAWGKEVEFEKGELTTRLETLRNSAIISGNIEEANAQAMELLQSHSDLGHIDADDSVAIRNSFRDELSKGYIEAQAPEKRAETLKQPWAKKYLPPDVYAGLKREADEALRIGKAQDQVDKYLAAGLDRAEVMGRIGKRYGADPELRKEVESRFDYAFAKQEKAVIEEQSGLFDEYFLPVRSGESTVDDIPRDNLIRMSPEQQNSLYAAQKSSVSSAKVPFNVGAEDQLNYLLKSRQFPELRKFFIENAGAMSDSQNKSWSEVSIEGVMPIEVESLFTAKDMVTSKTPNYSPQNRGILKDELDQWYRRQMETTNQVPTDDAISKKIDGLIMEYDPGFWSFEKPIYKMTEDEKTKVITNARVDDPVVFDDVSEWFKINNIQPDHAQFMEAYTQLKEKRDATR